MRWSDHIIDANLNRAREGLRVIEELARFVLRDEALCKRIRGMRHELQVHAPVRDVARDVGQAYHHCSRIRPIQILNANAARVQEALRVLEEYGDDPERFSRLRFLAYAIHQDLYASLNVTRLSGLYVIVDPDAYAVELDHVAEVVKRRAAAIVQLRYKSANKRELLSYARSLRTALPPAVMFIVNDHLDVALDCADGVHLGQNDFSVSAARKIAPPTFVVGASAHHAREAITAQEAGASYVAMGSVFVSKTKSDARPLDLNEARLARQELRIPLCLIGGIHDGNIEAVKELGADMIAMCAGVWGTSR